MKYPKPFLSTAMDSFLHLYDIYLSITRRQIVKRIFVDSLSRPKAALWITSALFLGTCLTLIVLRPSNYWLLVLVIVFPIWAWSLELARKSAFPDAYLKERLRARFYRKNYQYLRYCFFRDRITQAGSTEQVNDALRHLEEKLETEVTASQIAHPFISTMIAISIGIVTASAGTWSMEITIMSVLVTLAILYFSFAFIDLSMTPSNRLKEFKRFLLWLKEEQVTG